jgi:hypothetical protein
MDVLSPVSVVRCQVQVTAKGRSPSGEVLLSMISKSEQSGGLGPLGLYSHENKYTNMNTRIQYRSHKIPYM